MIVGAEQKRLIWKIWALGVVVDIAGAFFLTVILIRYFGSEGGSLWLGVALIWLGIQAARFIISLLNLARMWLANRVGVFNSTRDAFLQALRANEMPKPDGYIYSVSAYLQEVADAKEVDCDKRVVAATLYGIREGSKNVGLMHSVMLDQAHEEALRTYSG